MAITKITTPELFNLQSNNTEGTQLPVMTTTERAAMTGMSNGELIFNSTTDSVEYYDTGATAWYKIDYDPGLTVDYLVVAGGGGGGSWTQTSNVGCGGGGGAGGLRSSWTGGSGGGCASEATQTLAASTSYNVTVGSGGAGQPFNTSTQNNGGDSEFNSIVSTGGGAGGSYSGVNPNIGGSGGGAGYLQYGAAGTSCQGFIGGNYGTQGSPYRHGGGGGAGSGGNSGGTSGNGAGGTGFQSSITLASGTGPYYAGGGGGGVSYVTSVSPGGSAVGGSGGNQNLNATNPTVNTGSGGGGAGKGTSATQTTPSAGADGVVILRYPAGYTASSTLAHTDAVISGSTDRIITITGTGTGTVTFA